MAIITYKNAEKLGVTVHNYVITKEKNNTNVYFYHGYFEDKKNWIYVYNANPLINCVVEDINVICIFILDPTNEIWKIVREDGYNKNEDEKQMVNNYLRLLNGKKETIRKTTEIVFDDPGIEKIFVDKRKNTKKKKKRTKKESLKPFPGQISMLG